MYFELDNGRMVYEADLTILLFLYDVISRWAIKKKLLDHLAKLPDVRCWSSEEQEKYDESIKAVIPDDEEIEIK